MRRYLVCFSLMLKRILKTPAFMFMLLVMLGVAVAVSLAQRGEGAENVVGILLEEDKADETDLSAVYEKWGQDFTTQVNSAEGILQFRFYESRALLIRAVENGEADCGFVIPYDLSDMLELETWHGAVTVYESSSSALTQIAKERVAAAIFTLYSEKSYVNYIRNSEAFAVAQTGIGEDIDNNVNNDEGNNIEEIVDFAKNAYESHLIDGSTFDFVYNNDNGVINGVDESKYASIQNDVDIQNTQTSTETTFRLRGVLAVCIFISGMCGLLTDCKDRKEKRFLRIAPPWIITLANVWIPTLYTSAISYAALLLTGQMGGGDLLKELFRLLIYQFLIVIYCSIIRLALRKQETIAAAIPILTLACIICSPVWIRLSTYVPVFKVLEKLFPVTYYLIP
ncbi:MAG: hypothetical protein NC313_00500 [Butyrivibrio sp.]|nr:hypothetical protein [Butyrivibrio sp.]